jgi:Flp pilus assembly protein TadG
MASQRRVRNQRGVSLFVAIVSLLMIIPMIGLMIDVAVLYSVKARLQAAVDGASLAAARSLSLGATTAAQSTSAKQNAVNWFYANFPSGAWASTNTQMDANSVSVFDDANNPHIRNVTVAASTTAPTYFMKYLNFSSVNMTANGNASRRDVVVMMVLDRSGSMAGTCDDMLTAAKLFTGQFAAGRDQIGLVSFSDTTTLHSAPTTDFQSVLGYTNSLGTGAGAIDGISCSGGTGTAQAIMVAYNELYKKNLPGALNVLMFETDGLPNTLTLNFWDSANSVAGIASSSGCKDRNGNTISSSGFRNLSSLPNWTSGHSLGSGSYQSDIPAGIVTGIYSRDPSNTTSYFDLALNYWTGSYLSSTGCSFNSTHSTPSDFAWFPTSDVWGNQLNPSSAYKSVTMTSDGKHLARSSTTSTAWQNFHNAALNATDNAAYQARTNATLPAYFFGIGLGGNGTDDPDYILMQRMANDPGGDDYNTPAKYDPCAQETGCVTYSNQPQGTFIFSSNAQQLSQAFLSISSQILRLSK